MIRSRLFARIGLPLLVLLLVAPPATAAEFVVFPVKLALPVHVVERGTDGDKVVKKTLKEKDVVNLALGRSLRTKVDRKTEILAFAAARFSSDASDGKLVVFDPSQNGLAQVTAVISEQITVDFELAHRHSKRDGHEAQGTVIGSIEETTLGNPAENALHPSDLWAAGQGKAIGGRTSGKGVVAGRLSFTTTDKGQTTTWSGFIVNGKATISGKPIAMFDDGQNPGFCGDGIIQPELGEECEFNDQTACLPGTCGACSCRTCGNDRRDPGEICDGTDNDNCDVQSPPKPCREDCTGCATCGDGFISAHEECDIGNDATCPGLCLFPSCQCGCASDDPAGCPGTMCCSGARCWKVKTGDDDDPASPLLAVGCNGGSLPDGLCGDLLPPGSVCPDDDGDSGTFFACHECNGKFVWGFCEVTTTSYTCRLDHTGPLP